MNINRITAIILFYSTMIILPCLLAAWLIFAHETSLMVLCAKLAVAVLYAALIFVIGYWGFIGYFFRYAVLALSAASVAYAVLTGVEAQSQPPNVVLLAACMVVAVLLIYFLARTLAAFSYQGEPIELAFPFQSGRYYVLEGGDSKKGSLLNYHFAGSSHAKSNVNRSMRYATDIVRLNRFGAFSQGVFPHQTEKYVIYHEPLLCPCNGTVVEVVDGLDNEIPFSGRHPYNVGNHIVIQCGGINVLMGHLQKSSIQVKTGDQVVKGQRLADIGNSGLTEFPHLHIQAMRSADGSIWSGEGVPILFNNRLLCKNTIVKVR